MSEEIQEIITYHPDGSIASRAFKVNDQYEGDYISYYPNGQIHEKRFYKHGQMDGECTVYYSNGDLQRKSQHQYKEPPKPSDITLILTNTNTPFTYINQTDKAGQLFRFDN